MTKETEKILLIGAVAVGAYLLYKKSLIAAPVTTIPAPGSNAALNMLAPIIPTIGPVTPTPVMTQVIKTNDQGQPLTYQNYTTI